MHEYDVALKVLLQASNDSVFQRATGVNVARWLNAEMPQVQTSRADLLGAAVDGSLVHVELQSTNDPEMALRMAEYALRIYRLFKKYPKQIVLYVGEKPVRMPAFLQEPDAEDPHLTFKYKLIDIRDVDTDALLNSPYIEDNLLAVLTRFQDRMGTVRKILTRIANLDEPARAAAFAKLLIICELRRLGPFIKGAVKTMPILDDIMDHQIIGPAIRQGLQQGLQEGRQEGRHEMLLRLFEKRFGVIPEWVESRLKNLSSSELDAIGVRLLDATQLEELFPNKQ